MSLFETNPFVPNHASSYLSASTSECFTSAKDWAKTKAVLFSKKKKKNYVWLDFGLEIEICGKPILITFNSEKKFVALLATCLEITVDCLRLDRNDLIQMITVPLIPTASNLAGSTSCLTQWNSWTYACLTNTCLPRSTTFCVRCLWRMFILTLFFIFSIVVSHLLFNFILFAFLFSLNIVP